MKTAISIPDPLFKAAERLARRLRLSRSELFQRAVQAFVQNHDDAAITAALNEVYGPGHEASPLDPVLKSLQASSVPAEEW